MFRKKDALVQSAAIFLLLISIDDIETGTYSIIVLTVAFFVLITLKYAYMLIIEGCFKIYSMFWYASYSILRISGTLNIYMLF